MIFFMKNLNKSFITKKTPKVWNLSPLAKISSGNLEIDVTCSLRYGSDVHWQLELLQYLGNKKHGNKQRKKPWKFGCLRLINYIGFMGLVYIYIVYLPKHPTSLNLRNLCWWKKPPGDSIRDLFIPYGWSLHLWKLSRELTIPKRSTRIAFGNGRSGLSIFAKDMRGSSLFGTTTITKWKSWLSKQWLMGSDSHFLRHFCGILRCYIWDGRFSQPVRWTYSLYNLFGLGGQVILEYPMHCDCLTSSCSKSSCQRVARLDDEGWGDGWDGRNILKRGGGSFLGCKRIQEKTSRSCKCDITTVNHSKPKFTLAASGCKDLHPFTLGAHCMIPLMNQQFHKTCTWNPLSCWSQISRCLTPRRYCKLFHQLSHSYQR